jgi:hypothetical protein
MNPKTARPADAAASAGPRKIDQLAREIGPTNNPKPAELQAPPLLADTAGEDDRTCFGRRPGAATRLRLPWPSEYPADFIAHGGGVAFVRITVVKRDSATGQPTRVARRLQFCEGGNA